MGSKNLKVKDFIYIILTEAFCFYSSQSVDSNLQRKFNIAQLQFFLPKQKKREGKILVHSEVSVMSKLSTRNSNS